jgi:hypothetical protein
MGAALTYARRYALFTLVGIAGEDDIDAPDLMAPSPGEALRQPQPGNGPNGKLSQSVAPTTAANVVRARGGAPTPHPVMLDHDASCILRDRLIVELECFGTAEEAATWAHRVIGAKSTLMAADAKLVEEGFQRKLAEFEHIQPVGKRPRSRPRKSIEPGEPPIDKSELNYPEPRRLRDREHLRFVMQQPCLICGRTPSDPHHLRFTQPRALGRKVSDEFTVPLCRGHHREVHRCGDEAAWWTPARIDPSAAARELWLKTHPILSDPEMASAQHESRAGVSNRETNPVVAAGAQ